MKLIKRFILFLSIFLLVVPIHQTARACQYGRNCLDMKPTAQYVGGTHVTPQHIIQHRRAYITGASASHCRKPGATNSPAEENRADEDQVENEEEFLNCKKQVKQAYYFITPFFTQTSAYFDNCIRNSISLGMLSYTSSYRYILYNVIRI